MTELEVYSAYYQVKTFNGFRDLKIAISKMENHPGVLARHRGPKSFGWEYSVASVNGSLMNMWQVGDYTILEGRPNLNPVQKFLLKLFGVL